MIQNYFLQKQKYELAYNFLNHAACAIKNDYASMGEEAPFDVSEVLKEFDIVLQYSLLQIAVADNVLVKDEIDFISNLTITGDLMDEIDDLTWDDLLNYDIYFIKLWLNNIHDPLYDLSRRFSDIIAVFDATIKEYDFIQELSEIFAFLKSGIILADGNISMDQIFENCLIFECLESAKETKKKIEKGL